MPTQAVTSSPFPSAPVKAFNPSAPDGLAGFNPTPPAQQQVQAPSAVAASTQTPSGLDPTIVNLAKSIRSTETSLNGDFTAQGKSGEYGAYQFTQPTWDAQASKLGITTPYNQATPQEQNAVAYSYLKDLKDKGYNVGQIASIWNSGKPDPTGNVGVNSEGVSYNTPAYVSKVYSTYQTLKGQSPTVAGTDQPAPDASSAQPPSIVQSVWSGIKGLGNFLFPIVGDVYNDVSGTNTKTALQQAGDLGVSALGAATLIPGLGPEALAARAGLVGEEGLGLAGKIGVNAALGAGFGVGGALGSGATDAGSIAQGGLVGGVTGGALGAAGEALASKLGKVAQDTGEERLTSQKNSLKVLSNAFKDNSRPAIGGSGETNPITTLQTVKNEAGKSLASLIKVTDGKVNTEELTNEARTGAVDNLIENHADAASQLVDTLQGSVPFNDFKNSVMTEIQNDPTIRGTLSIPKATAAAERMMDSAHMSYGEEIPYNAIDEIRRGMNKVYDPDERDVARIIGDTARTALYEGGGTNAAIKSAMANEAELIRARNFLEKLQGTTVKGGRLGTYFSRILGGQIGEAVGGGLGTVAGPYGAAVGAVTGGVVGDQASKLLQNNYFDPLQSRVARKLVGAATSGVGQVARGTAKAAALRAVTQQ